MKPSTVADGVGRIMTTNEPDDDGKIRTTLGICRQDP